MAQHNFVGKAVPRYTRTDYTALRFRLNRVDLDVIRNTVLMEDDLAERGLETNAELGAWLDDMRDHLIARASIANPHIASALADARKFNNWSKSAMNFLVHGPERESGGPTLSDSVSVWFRPVIARHLKAECLLTMGDLKSYIERRGHTWYRPIPRIGPGKAKAILAWMQKNMQAAGGLVLPTVTSPPNQVVLDPERAPVWIPLERISKVTPSLDGSAGINRNHDFCLISARNDLEAVHAYLDRYRDQEKTYRAYRKELERFLLWCVGQVKVPLSGVLVEECAAYKSFLANPALDWCGKRATKNTAQWRPFAGPLSLSSQRYAVLVLRGFFSWLLDVRYLRGNPWVLVKSPKPIQREHLIQIEKALPKKLWDSLVMPGGILDRVCAQFPAPGAGGPLSAKQAQTAAVQYRLARAAILLMGMTGIRREEAAYATRNHLVVLREQIGQPNAKWELKVIGKGFKERTVLVPARVIDALREHWSDRGHDFSFGMTDLALLSPVVIPNTPAGKAKHLEVSPEGPRLSGNGFSPDGLYQLLKAIILRVAEDPALPLSEEERALLKHTAPHALRHTFATQAATKVPMDVLQKAMGHASQQTTTIYINAERARSIEEMAKYLNDYDI